MDAATLRVLVEVNGVRRATKDLRDVDNAGTRAARSANTAAGGFDNADRSARRASKGFSGLVAAMGGGNNGARNFARTLDRFGGSAGRATATIGGFRIALAALIPVIIGFGGAVVAAGASLGPLVGLIGAAGAGGVAAAQGFGVFKLATLGIKEALKASGKDAKKFEEELAKLPPAAQGFTRALVDMKPKLDSLRQSAARGFFPGATEGLQAATRNFEPLRRVVELTAGVLGDLARRAGELVGSASFGKDIQTVGESNARVIGSLGRAAIHLADALRHVLVAAGPLTEWLARSVEKWAENTAAAAKAGRENGKLAGFFEKTRAITKRLTSIITHLASGLLGLGKVGKVSGDSIWLSIDRAATRFDEWANSVKGQKQLRDFFEDTKRLAAALTPVLAGIGSALSLLVLRILPLSAILKVLGPYTDEAVTAFLAFKLASLAVGVASRIATAGMVAATFATGGWTTAFWALNAALVANPIGLVVLAIAGLVAALVIAWKNSETFRDIVKSAFEVVATAFGWILTAASNVLGWLKSNWPGILQVLTGPVGLAVVAIRGFGPKMLSAADWLLDRFIAGVHAVASSVVAVGGWIVGKVSDGVRAITGFATEVGSWVKDKVVSGVHSFAETISELGGWVIGKIVGGAKAVAGVGADVGEFIKDKISSGVRAVAETFTNIGGDIIRGIAQGIRNGAAAVANAVKDAVQDAWNWVKRKFKIRSPSLVFAELGRNMSLGMAQGIASEAGRVQRAMADISTVPSVAGGTIGAMGHVTPTQSLTTAPSGPTMAGVTIMGDLVVQDRSDADTVAARLAWLMENG